MNAYSHVKSTFIRSILTGNERNIKAIAGAAYATEFAFHDDLHNSSIDETVIVARERAIETMTDCLLDFDVEGAIAAMRAYWNI
jgi:hypothetical protein